MSLLLAYSSSPYTTITFGAASKASPVPLRLPVLVSHPKPIIGPNCSHAALVLRLILLSLFSVIILAAALFGVAWTASQTTPLLVTLLAAITTLFYARWVRQKALINNIE